MKLIKLLLSIIIISTMSLVSYAEEYKDESILRKKAFKTESEITVDDYTVTPILKTESIKKEEQKTEYKEKTIYYFKGNTLPQMGVNEDSTFSIISISLLIVIYLLLTVNTNNKK